MIEARITESNFLLIAMHNYDNSQCVNIAEFEEDLKRFGYLKKLFGRYKDGGELKERLIINHLIVIYNVFGIEAATKLLFLKMDNYGSYLKPFLLFLNYCPDIVYKVEGRNIMTSEIGMDSKIVEKLRKINEQTRQS